VKSADLFAFSARALRGHRLRSGLTLLGVAIGAAAVVMLTALGEGAQRYVMGQFEGIGSNLLAVVPGKTETHGAAAFASVTTEDLTLEDAEAILRAVPEAARVAPIATGTETVSHAERSRQVAILGTTADFLEVQRVKLGRGENLPRGDLRRGTAVTLLGATVAAELFPAADPLGGIVRIGDLRARVIGVLEAQGTQLGSNLNEVALIPVAKAMRLFNRSSLFRIVVDVRAHADLSVAKQRVVDVLKQRHGGEEDVTVITQDAVVKSFSNILRTLTLSVAAIAAISLAVSGLGIMNVMLVSVSERTSEVGLLRALGAERAQISSVFLAEALLLSAAGALAGIALGVAAVEILAWWYPKFPAAPPLWSIGAALALALAAGGAFGLAPARRAARLDPVAALGKK
jgi:putative ABC transport system permease protein